MTRLSDDQIIAYTKAAMAPYECVHEFRDYGARFGYAVYVDDGDRYVNENLLTRELRHVENLERVLLAHRAELESQHKLKFNAWDGIPSQTDC